MIFYKSVARIKTLAKTVFVFLVLWSCAKEDTQNTTPTCIEDKINQIKQERVRNPPASVWRWKTNTTTYYYITSDCCDQFNYLYDTMCNRICAPDGGITGKGDGKCPSFSTQTEKTLIWKDSR